MYGVNGKLIAKPGQRDALIEIMLASGSNDLPGNHIYIISVDPSDADGIWIYEIWDSQASHQASLQLDSVQIAITLARPLIAGFSSRVEFEPIAGKGLP